MLRLVSIKLSEKKSAIIPVHFHFQLNSDHLGYTVYIDGKDVNGEVMKDHVVVSLKELESLNE